MNRVRAEEAVLKNYGGVESRFQWQGSTFDSAVISARAAICRPWRLTRSSQLWRAIRPIVSANLDSRNYMTYGEPDGSELGHGENDHTEWLSTGSNAE